tara:strand:- start:48 stop:818 length:771 start_codon:yes stop_codon:yes gene_type:complete
MAFNVLSGTISPFEIIASGSFSGSFVGDGEHLENVEQFTLYGSTTAGRLIFYKTVNGESHLEADANLHYDTTADVLNLTRMSASSGINLSGITAGQTTTSSYLALDSNKNIILTSSSGKISELNNRVANRLVTIGATTTELDGEANLTFDGNTLSLQGGLVLKRRQINSITTASVSDYFIGIAATGDLEVRLPNAASLTSGQTFIFKDENGSAASHVIKIIASGSQTIDDSNFVILESPYAAVNIYTDGVSKYFIY